MRAHLGRVGMGYSGIQWDTMGYSGIHTDMCATSCLTVVLDDNCQIIRLRCFVSSKRCSITPKLDFVTPKLSALRHFDAFLLVIIERVCKMHNFTHLDMIVLLKQ